MKIKRIRAIIASEVARKGKPSYFVDALYDRAKKLYHQTPRNKREHFNPIEALNDALKGHVSS